jgi:MFS transporter, Spinster family, sphingosine-1-phosphate transporter
MQPRRRWVVVSVLFLFMLLHQTDKLLIGPLTTPIMETFKINEAQMGMVFTGAIIVAALFYPLWGYLYDRFARAKLLALASFIWGATTWFSAVAPNFRLFVASRATTGIDDSSYPGLYSLVSDYFGPRVRGRIYGLLQVAMPMGYMMGLILSGTLRDTLGWRNIYLITGGVGIVVAALIFFLVKEAPRGQSEPEMADLNPAQSPHFEWRKAAELFRKPSLLLLFAQGFFGVFPWNVLTYWAFRYIETERGYTTGQTTITMAVAILALSAGYFSGGALGDWAFRRTRRGRALVGAVAVLLGAILLYLALNVPIDQPGSFTVLLACTAFFMPFAAPNVTATVHDVTLPEVRSTALAVQYFIEEGGSAAAPLIAGLIAVRSSLQNAMLIICISAWIFCAVVFLITASILPRDIEKLRQAMRERAAALKQAQPTS